MEYIKTEIYLEFKFITIKDSFNKLRYVINTITM